MAFCNPHYFMGFCRVEFGQHNRLSVRVFKYNLVIDVKRLCVKSLLLK